MSLPFPLTTLPNSTETMAERAWKFDFFAEPCCFTSTLLVDRWHYLDGSKASWNVGYDRPEFVIDAQQHRRLAEPA